jgi:hypothetical protein
MVATLCVALFIKRCIIDNRSIVASLVLLQICLSLWIGYIFLGTSTALASSIKMMFPLFVGFCFCDRDLGQYPRTLQIVTVTFYISLVGIFLSKFWMMPWVGFKYESFGATREAGRLWWSFAEQRLSGFAAESTMAAYFVLVAYVITSVRKSTMWCLVLGGISGYAIRLTTSKTTLGVLAVYIVCMLIVRALPEERRLPMVRKLASTSFLAVFVPIIAVLTLSGVQLASGHNGFFFSIQDRINHGWQQPFIYLMDLMPVGLITGCGVGCFGYPQLLFSNLQSYWLPVDNFYVGTYLIFGLPFVFFVWLVFRATLVLDDVYKLSLIFTMNIFTITVLSYGPAMGLLVIAMAFGSVFAKSMTAELQGGKRHVRGDPDLDAPLAVIR